MELYYWQPVRRGCNRNRACFDWNCLGTFHRRVHSGALINRGTQECAETWLQTLKTNQNIKSGHNLEKSQFWWKAEGKVKKILVGKGQTRNFNVELIFCNLIFCSSHRQCKLLFQFSLGLRGLKKTQCCSDVGASRGFRLKGRRFLN